MIRCLMYIDLNMVQAGAVKHSSEWETGGFNEIQTPPARYGVIDRLGLHEFCGIPESESFAEHHRQWVQDAMQNVTSKRESRWAEAIAVGSSDYVEEIRGRLGIKAAGRRIEKQESGICIIREKPASYNAVFDPKNENPRQNNEYFGECFWLISGY